MNACSGDRDFETRALRARLSASRLFKLPLFYWFATAATIFCFGCSSAEFPFGRNSTPPTSRLSQAELSVRAAEEAKAADLAPLDLQSAREKLTRARQALSANKYEDARRLAESAQVDAQLAEAKADAAIMRRAADQILRRADAPPSRAELESRKPLAVRPGTE
jgi:uncharacterized protein DUF4398